MVEEDVANEKTPQKNLSYTCRKSSDVGSLEAMRITACHRRAMI
jgi:hypothetical protein